VNCLAVNPQALLVWQSAVVLCAFLLLLLFANATKVRMVAASSEVTVQSCQARPSSATARLTSTNQQPVRGIDGH